MDRSATGFGAELRLAREARGLTLADVAGSTRISSSALAAIEREEFERLPGGIYRRGFIRAYADAVGLDGPRWVRRYAETFEAPPPPPRDSERPAPPRGAKSSLPRADWPLVAALGAAVALSAIALHSVRRLPPEAASGDRPAGIEHAVPPEPLANPEAGSGLAIDAGQTVGLRVRIAVSEPCWISAEADGSRVVHRLFDPGDQVDVDAASTIMLRVGDPGAFTWTINGRPARRPGIPGEAVTVEITPATIDALLVRDAGSTL